MSLVVAELYEFCSGPSVAFIDDADVRDALTAWLMNLCWIQAHAEA